MVHQHQQENHDANWTVETKSKGFRAALSAEAWVRGVSDRATARDRGCRQAPPMQDRISHRRGRDGGREGGNKGECQGGASLRSERKSFLNSIENDGERPIIFDEKRAGILHGFEFSGNTFDIRLIGGGSYKSPPSTFGHCVSRVLPLCGQVWG